MKHLWSRFESHTWTAPLLLLTYAPSLLLAPLVAIAMVPSLSLRDWGMVLFAAATVLSYGIPAACAATWLTRSLRPDHFSKRTARIVTVLAVLGWLPHYVAVACWLLVGGLRQEGLVP